MDCRVKPGNDSREVVRAGRCFCHAASCADGVHDTLGVMRGLDPRIHDAAPPSQAVLILPLQSIMDCQVKPGNDSEEVGRPCTERNAVQHGPDNADIVWWLFATE
jgi:hypothetical protein